MKLPVLLPALPEIFLALFAMALMMLGVFAPAQRAFKAVSSFAVAALVATLVLVLINLGGRGTALNGLFIVDGFGIYMKALALIPTVRIVTMVAATAGARRHPRAACLTSSSIVMRDPPNHR